LSSYKTFFNVPLFNFDLERIYAGVFASNYASARVLEKGGYTFEGRLRNHVAKEGKTMDLLMYAILKAEVE